MSAVRRVVCAVSAVGFAFAVPGVWAATAGATPSEPSARQGIAWTACPSQESNLKGVECGALDVPLDATNPAVGTVTLRMARLKASGPQRKGTLFVNPGGPGGNAMGAVKRFAAALGPDISERWDVVGVNPRGVDGVGSPNTFTCDVPVAELRQVPAFAWRDDHADALIHLKGVVAGACTSAKLARLAPYMTTADYVRDLDRIRQELGETHLNLYGVSYGTQVGATYAAMFPATTGRMVLDSAMNAKEWVGIGVNDPRVKPHDERLGSGPGSLEMVQQGLLECERAGESACPGASTVRGDFAAVTSHLRQQELILEMGEPLTYDEFITSWVYSGYRASAFPHLITLTTSVAKSLPKPPLRARSDASAAVAGLRALRERVQAEVQAEQGVTRAEARTGLRAHRSVITTPMAYDAVACTDGVNPRDPQLWKQRLHEVDDAAPGFGPTWFWPALTCATWPYTGAHPFPGPFEVKAANPALIVNNQFDPSTPLAGATALHATLPGSRLLTVERGFGHGAVGISDCARRATVAYLDTGVFPATNQVCAPDRPLFTALLPSPAPPSPSPSTPAPPSPSPSTPAPPVPSAPAPSVPAPSTSTTASTPRG